MSCASCLRRNGVFFAVHCFALLSVIFHQLLYCTFALTGVKLLMLGLGLILLLHAGYKLPVCASPLPLPLHSDLLPLLEWAQSKLWGTTQMQQLLRSGSGCRAVSQGL